MVWDAFLVAHYATSSRHLLVDIAALAIKDVLDSPILNMVYCHQDSKTPKGPGSMQRTHDLELVRDRDRDRDRPYAKIRLLGGERGKKVRCC